MPILKKHQKILNLQFSEKVDKIIVLIYHIRIIEISLFFRRRY
jgi:hypothetical protein